MNILAQEKRLFNLLTLMESIRNPNENEIKINCEGEEFTITLTSKNHYKKSGTALEDYKNKIEIEWQNGNKLVFEKHFEHKYVDGEIHSIIEYKGEEFLSNGELIELSNHHMVGEYDELEYIKKSQEKEIAGEKLKIIYNGNIPYAVVMLKKGPIVGLAPLVLEKNNDMITLSAEFTVTDCYNYFLYNGVNNTYYLEIAKRIVPLEEITDKLDNIENSLKATKKCLDENELPYIKILNPQIFDFLDESLKEFGKRRKVIEYMKKNLEVAVKNEYFKINLELIEFSEGLTEELFNQIFVGIEMMKKKNEPEELSDKEKKCVFKKIK